MQETWGSQLSPQLRNASKYFNVDTKYLFTEYCAFKYNLTLLSASSHRVATCADGAMAGPQPADPSAPGDREPARAHLHGRVREQA